MRSGWLFCFACACGNSSATPDGGTDASTDVAAEANCIVTGDWSCVGKESLPAVTSATIAQPFTLYDGSGSGVDVGLSVKACAFNDTTCTTPVGAPQNTDANGQVTFSTLPTGANGFDGYFEVDSPNDPVNLNFVNPPLFAVSPSYNRVFYSGGSINNIAETAGVTLDPTLGVLGIEVHDCSQYPNNVACFDDGGCKVGLPGGVTLSIDNKVAKTTVGYFTDVNGLIGLSTTVACTSAGDNGLGEGAAGRGGFLNVPPGPVTITAKLATGETVATFKVFVRANAISLVTLPPTL